MKRVIFLLFCVISFSLVVFLGSGENVVGSSGDTGLKVRPSHGQRAILHPDQIKIEAMAKYGKLDRPMVVFPHDLHTDALESSKEGCKACHLDEKGSRTNKFMRLKDTNREELLKIYHDNCIGCHQKKKDAKEVAGPVECGRCHTDKPYVASAGQPMEMDASLHYRHSKAYENKCDACHHEYNEQTKKLFYAKGKEGSCRYCHKPITEGNRISMRLASHDACVNCHQKLSAKKKQTGPIQCAGCHDASKRKKIKVVADVKRIDRNQPDTILIHTGNKTAKVRMPLVPFDHKAHEMKNGSCRTCHHEAISACNTCHTVNGDKKGNHITLEQAMHNKEAGQSCLGCHAEVKRVKNCAGCHASMPATTVADNQTCNQCHMPLKPDTSLPATTTAEEEAQVAKAMLDSRPVSLSLPDLKDVPEFVTIKAIADKYQPVKVPHLKVIKTLQKGIADNRLTINFHNEAKTLCQGCHHNAPAAMKPTACISCHSSLTSEKDSVKPGIMGAYHQQCMECHKNMGLSKPAGCTDCHAEAKKS